MPIISGYQPAQNTLQQYVPLPFQEMMVAGQAVQGRADKFNETADTFADALLKAKVLEGDKEILQQNSKKFQSVLDEANKSNIADPTVYQKLKSQIKSIAADPEFIKAQEHYAYNQKAMENYSDIVKAGDYGDELTWDYMQSLQNYNKSGGLRGGNNLENNMFTKGTKINEGMEKYFDEIPQTGSESLHALGEYYYKTGWKGITEGRINNAAMTAFTTFANSPEGNQMKMQYKMKVDQGLIDPNKTGAGEWIFNQFLATGKRKVGGVSDLGDFTTVHNKMIDDIHAKMREQTADGEAMESPLESLNSASVDGILSAFNTASGTSKIPTGGSFSMNSAPSPFANSGLPGFMKPKSDKKPEDIQKTFYDNLSPDQKKTYDNLKISLGTDEKALAYLNKIKDRKVSSSYIGWNTKTSNDESAFIQRNLNSMRFYNLTTGKIEYPEDVRKKITKDTPLIGVGQYSNDNIITDVLPDQTMKDYFIKPKLVTIGDQTYAVGQTLGDINSDSHKADIVINKLSQARRTGLPIELSPDYRPNDNVTNMKVEFINNQYILHYERSGDNNTDYKIKGNSPQELYIQLRELRDN